MKKKKFNIPSTTNNYNIAIIATTKTSPNKWSNQLRPS